MQTKLMQKFFNRASRNGRRSVGQRRTLQVEHLETRRLLAAISMTNQEQLLLELVNRARKNPGAEAALFGINLNQGVPSDWTISNTPKQPLAPNQLLIGAARLHSQDMLNRDYFGHRNPPTQDPALNAAAIAGRIAGAGYTMQGAAENIAWGGSPGPNNQTQQVYAGHEGLFKSVSHRLNLLNGSYHEFGAGVRDGVFTQGVNVNATMITEIFAKPLGNTVFITGVAFTDQITSDSFYTVGEGIGGLTVVAESSTGNRLETQTGPSGGYSLEVEAGTYTLTFSGGSLPRPYSYTNIVVGSENVKRDLNTRNPPAAPPVTLQLVLATTSISENGGTTTATVSRTGLNTSSLIVNLTSSDTTEATVPPTVTIPVGSGSAQFTITAVNDTLFDGDQNVTIAVSATGATSGSAILKVVDDERAALSISLASNSVIESAGTVSGTISRTGPTSSALSVNLTSSDTTEATVPASVTIPVGASSATFSIAVVNDTIPDGSQPVTITAASAGLTSVTATLTVTDDDILIAQEDSAITLRARTVDVAILFNDQHPSSSLSDLTVQISTPPASSVGTALIVGGNLLRFTPASGFTGIATMHYVLRDPRIGQSQPARVRIGVAATAKQNPWLPVDVNGDGRVSSSDALSVINLLNTPGASRRVDDMSDPLRQPFLDVSGDGRISAHDALLVINHLNTRSSGEGEGETSTNETELIDRNESSPGFDWAADIVFEQTWTWLDTIRRRRR